MFRANPSVAQPFPAQTAWGLDEPLDSEGKRTFLSAGGKRKGLVRRGLGRNVGKITSIVSLTQIEKTEAEVVSAA